MGCVNTFCENKKKEDYLIDLFEYMNIRNISDEAYVVFIHSFVQMKEKSFELDESRIRKITVEGNDPNLINNFMIQEINNNIEENIQFDKQKLVSFKIPFDSLSVKEYKELKGKSPFKTKHKTSEIRKKTILRNISSYIDDLIDSIFENFLYSDMNYFNKDTKDNQTIENIKNLSQFTLKDDSYENIQKESMNQFFSYLKQSFNDESSKVEFIISLLFLTKSSFHSISGCIAKLYKIFKGVNIIRREGNFFYINNKKISSILKILFNKFTYEAVDYAHLLLKDKTMMIDYENNYKKYFSYEVITFYIENNFDFTFIEETSLAYFLKILLPNFNSIEAIVDTMIKTYSEFIKEEEIKIKVKYGKDDQNGQVDCIPDCKLEIGNLVFEDNGK